MYKIINDKIIQKGNKFIPRNELNSDYQQFVADVVGIGTTLLGSDSEYIVRDVSDQDEYDTYNENIVVESEADSIIDFTEDNPFGDF